MPEEIYDPRERLEIFLNAVRTGDVEGLPDPQTREEMYLAAIAGKSALPDPTDASAGDALVLDEDKNPVWSAPPTPTIPKKYLHNIELINNSGPSYYHFSFVNDVATPYTNQTDAIQALYALIGEHEYIATGFQVRTVIYAIAPKAIGTFTAYGVSIAISNNALSFTHHDDWGVSVTTLTCNDLVCEI